ncbi:MAG: PRC-barrel domain-containing protein [Cytophagaceae bacterium]|nr:PRC-barrel domain-containing protein [Cytophagaceae bacterium]
MNPELIEKDNLTGHNHTGPNANRPLKLLTARSIVGDKIENTKGEKIGKIKDIMLDVKRGYIEYVILECGGFLGGKKLFAIPFTALAVNPKNHDFILDVDKEFLKNAPGFDKNHWPETNGHYVHEYWGNFMGPSVGGTPG